MVGLHLELKRLLCKKIYFSLVKLPRDDLVKFLVRETDCLIIMLYIYSLQTAVTSSSDATNISKQQLNDKQQQIIELQKNLSESEHAMKEKDSTISALEKEIGDLKLSVATEVRIMNYSVAVSALFL